MGKNSYKKLLSSSLIFGLGDIGSKGITLLLVPLYTFYLTQSEYGWIDIIQTTINVLVPLISLSIYEAVLRYVMDKENVKEVFTNSFFITCITSLGTFLIFIIIQLFNDFNGIFFYTSLVVILQQFQMLFSQFIRGIGKINTFAINGLIMAITTAIMTLILIVWLKFGIEGYLLSIIIAQIISILYLNLNVNTLRYIKISTINKVKLMNLLSYSLPLIPNSLMWWVINASSRYFILIFAGTTYNGLFAVASKVPSLLSMFNSIFFKAWQLSAIEEYNSKDKTVFFSNIFNYFQQFLFIIIGIILLFLKIIFANLIGDGFFNAWKYVPFLMVAVLFSSFSSFLGTNYIASKETKGVFKTSVIGGIINLALNFITIPLIGVIGASLSSMLSFLVITIIRWHDTKRYINIKYDYKNILINFILISFEITVMYVGFGSISEFTIQLLIFGILLLINRSVLIGFFNLIKGKLIK